MLSDQILSALRAMYVEHPQRDFFSHTQNGTCPKALNGHSTGYSVSAWQNLLAKHACRISLVEKVFLTPVRDRSKNSMIHGNGKSCLRKIVMTFHL